MPEKFHLCPAGKHGFYCPICMPDGYFAPSHMKSEAELAAMYAADAKKKKKKKKK